jgi:hypothetical protein
MGLFGLGKKKDKEAKSEDKLKKDNSSASKSEEQSFEQDLNWDESLPGFDKKEKQEMSLPKDDSNELDSLASDAGLSLPDQKSEEKPQENTQPQPNEEDTSLPDDFPEDVFSNEEPKPKQEMKKPKPKSQPKPMPETASEPRANIKIYIKNNSLFIPQEDYEEFYSTLNDVDSELDYMKKEQEEIKGYEDEIKDSGDDFAREIRAISSIAMDCEDMIRKGGDKNE